MSVVRIVILSICLGFFGWIATGDDLRGECDFFLWNSKMKKDNEKCKTEELRSDQNLGFKNLLQLNGAYCFNNGSGICKGFSGKFEFYFNTFTDEILGPAPSTNYSDKNGYHMRVPQSYNINGEIQYVDKSINWAKQFKLTIENNKISLLSINEFNWCAYTENDWWPYKTAIKDKKSNGRYLIYFYNRQSCIIDTQKTTNNRQHFNTRFKQNSSLRIDLDYNPTIFAMEDHLANDIRLVKHFRQHWYEVPYEVIQSPKQNVRLFLRMDDNETLPSKINETSGPIVPAVAYSKYTDLCVSDYYQYRNGTGKNARLVQHGCGLDQAEIADLTYPQFKQTKPIILNEVHLHSIPRYPEAIQGFYGIDVRNDEDWMRYAKDGFSFSATTTIPIDNSTDKVRVLSLYSKFQEAFDEYDENYPTPYISDYIATFEGGNWKFDRETNKKELKNLNYVDDIAYLHKCDTILIIFGPLYTELAAKDFDISSKATLDSIYNLNLWELTSAFFAVPESDSIWFYHRSNYISEHKYTCANGPNNLVTAKRVGGYHRRMGTNPPPLFQQIKYGGRINLDYSEEYLMQTLGVFKGTIVPEPPDPEKYPIGSIDPPKPQSERSGLLIYIIVGIGLVLILAMCIACLVTLRRRHRRRDHLGASTARSGALGSQFVSKSRRSALASGSVASTPRSSNLSMTPTNRSSMKTSHSSRSTPSLGRSPTKRSTMTNKPSSHSTRSGSSVASRSSAATRRSRGL